ncbi:glutathione S-transferase, N-terminal domain [Parvibaculum lavamentivorans DS-1]|uniref:Glutathione S-transferase, N-terminal domain n=1 Tax=Parvibaculum lavamentivorans (strain DS-1 / DSM 13023 / NCIMB 13966) TaxID=402881 RepID=A7HUQ0_PARL1|nr:glutathione S-transferase family protein [Parvibaculum lavamentivorans]ABS63633.1 glutathione S-transferase, N-terminal domain [Parvibaculum lavamentivorans DS-1]
MGEDKSELELHQFSHSHYNEKVRWALDYKGLPHWRLNYLPGPHAVAIRKMTGATETPVLKVGGLVVTGSAAIIDALEASYPASPLYPAGPQGKDAVLAVQSFFDTEVGPQVRRAFFSELVHEPAYLCAIFASGKSLPSRIFYRATLGVARGLIRRQMGLDRPGATEEAFHATQSALDRVAAQTASTGYMVGDSFTVADLAAAALLAPACAPSHPDMELPVPRPPRVEAWLSRWAAHPGASWVRDMYDRHRPKRVLALRHPAE